METLATPTNSLKEKNLLQIATGLASALSQNITEEENNGRLSSSAVNALCEM